MESPPTDSIGKLVWKLLKRDAPAYKRFRKGADLVAFCEVRDHYIELVECKCIDLLGCM